MKKLNAENFESIVSEEKGLFIIKFSSPTCGPCGTMKSVFEALDERNPEINCYEIDTQESPELAAHFGVRGVPFVAFCEDREVLYNFTGVTPLADMQFVISNINDPYFREHGEFPAPDVQKKNYWFEMTIGLAILIYFFAFFVF